MVLIPIVSGVLELLRDLVTPRAFTKYTFKLPVDTTRPVSSECFEACANDYKADRLSYEEFLDAALAHIDPKSPTLHPEDSDLANLAKLSTCGPMGPVAAAIKLCMLRDDSKRSFSQEAIDMLHLMKPSATSTELRSAAPFSDLPPLQLQIVIVAALQRELPTLATEILSSNPPPAPPKASLFNLLDSTLCPVSQSIHLSRDAFDRFPIEFWTAAVKARWVAPSPSLGERASGSGPPGAPLLRALLDAGLDVTLFKESWLTLHRRNLWEDSWPLYRSLLWDVAQKHDDPSLLKDILARIPHKKLDPELLRYVVNDREQGGVEMLAMLLDRGLNINYRDKTRVSLQEQFDVWAGDWWYQVSLTALHVAAKKGNKDAVSFLISRGANVAEPEYFGNTARDLALREGQHEIVQLFDEVAKH
ncbi:hypothetical protein F4678DRAFT_294050 [Xylaria arbuscula]|nr:hypothetical protein F4678DRAFT_294050 [Xylaria arbuscula]